MNDSIEPPGSVKFLSTEASFSYVRVPIKPDDIYEVAQSDWLRLCRIAREELSAPKRIFTYLTNLGLTISAAIFIHLIRLTNTLTIESLTNYVGTLVIFVIVAFLTYCSHNEDRARSIDIRGAIRRLNNEIDNIEQRLVFHSYASEYGGPDFIKVL